MSAPFASGKKAIAACDRCGFRFKLKELKKEIVKTKPTGLLVCRACWSPDHPQLLLGMYPVYDPQALRAPRPEQLVASRDIAWGWNPVGQCNSLTPDTLLMRGAIGTATVTTT